MGRTISNILTTDIVAYIGLAVALSGVMKETIIGPFIPDSLVQVAGWGYLMFLIAVGLSLYNRFAGKPR